MRIVSACCGKCCNYIPLPRPIEVLLDRNEEKELEDNLVKKITEECQLSATGKH